MTLVRTPDVAPEHVEQAVELAETLGAEGGEMVMHPILGYEVPEFRVSDDKVRAFVKGFMDAGATNLRISNS